MGQIGPADDFGSYGGVLLENIEELICVPEYLSAFSQSHGFMMKGDGPLTSAQRYYIAILAVARHRCRWLLEILKLEFLKARGDVKWLRGYKHAPVKLAMLDEVNKLLAHKPWLLDRAHIQKLLGPGKNKWLMGEVVQAICVLVHFHSLCSLILGHGVKLNESDAKILTDSLRIEVKKKRKSRSISFQLPFVENRECNFGLNAGKTEIDDHEEDSGVVEIATEVDAFLEDQSFCYEDWSNKEKGDASVQPLSPADYGWDTQGFCMLNRLYNDVGYLLDERFHQSQSYAKSALTAAVWNYVQTMFAVQIDDYEYSEVTRLLQKDFKSWLKTVTCYPERLGEDGPPPEERHHILMLVVEARIQCALLYALRALSRHYMLDDS